MLQDYNDGYCVGWEEGRQSGLQEGYNEAYEDLVELYEKRIKALYTELQTLNARVDYLNKKLDDWESKNA